MSRLTHRIVLALLPAFLLISAAVHSVWGDRGIIARAELSQELRAANDDLSVLDRENQRLLHQLEAIRQDPLVVERMVAEEIGWGREGTVIYGFGDGAQ